MHREALAANYKVPVLQETQSTKHKTQYVEHAEKMEAFKKKIALWADHISRGRFDTFSRICHEKQQRDNALTKAMTVHLTKLQDQIKKLLLQET